MFGFSGFLPIVFVLTFLFPRRKDHEVLSLCELNELCGVHNFDLNGIKNKNLVIDDSTEFGTLNDVILFRGCGSDINNSLNSILASHRGWFEIFRKIEKGQYVKWGRGKRTGNYEAYYDAVNKRIKYVFPVKYTTDLYTPRIFLLR
jgi:hypothetical protein